MKTYDLTLTNGKNTITLGLRLNVAAQMALKKKYNEEAVSSLLSAVSDVEKMVYIFGLALSYKNNENAITDGAEFYDLLVDNGFAGQNEFMKILTSVAAASGLITAKQKKQIDAFAEGTTEEAFGEVFGEDEDEKNARTSGE